MAAGILIDSDGKRVIWTDGKRRIGEDGDPCCCYRQARLCSDDSLADVWMTDDDAATLPGAFSLDDDCYYFDVADPLSTPGTIYTPADVTTFDSCEDCEERDPCEHEGDLPPNCDSYHITYTRTIVFYSSENCVGELTTAVSGQDRYLDRSIENSWVDGLGEVVLALDCPLGWVLCFSDPFNFSQCCTARLTGLTPKGGYPSVTCCQNAGDGTSVKITYSAINVVCDDTP